MIRPACVLWALAALTAPVLTACEADARADDAADVLDALIDVDTDDTTPAAPPEPVQLVAVLTEIWFVPVAEDGTVDGFDLDVEVSDGKAGSGCGIDDYDGPDGIPGIDSQFSTLLPLLAAAGGSQVEGLLQSQIDNGNVLLIVRIDDVHDPTNDDAVGLTMTNGLGDPYLGTNGRILSGQTFDIDPAAYVSELGPGAIADGVITAPKGEARLSVQILNQVIELDVFDTMVRARVTDDGEGFEGVMAGGITVEQIISVAERADAAVAKAFVPFLRGAADLAPDEDGDCTRISGTIGFRGVSAFLFDDE